MNNSLDDYNWKFPSRTDTMYLSKLQKPQRNQSQQRNSLKIDDIEGTRPKFMNKQYYNKQTFINRTDDIQKSKPKTSVILNKPDNQLNTRDIEGTNPQYNKFITTRQTNPLAPVYKLCKVNQVAPLIPHFIRDNINVDDIQGTKTKQTFYMKLQKKGRFIQKQQLKQKQKKSFVKNQNFLDVTDINNEGKFCSKRVTNPLEPQYEIMNQQNQKVEIGPIQFSKPRQPLQMSKPNYNFHHGDIEGSYHQPLHNIQLNKKNQQILQKITNYIKDIKGTQVNSKKHGIQSKRVTNPLEPKYQLPGHTQEPVIKPTIHSRPKTALQKFDNFIS